MLWIIDSSLSDLIAAICWFHAINMFRSWSPSAVSLESFDLSCSQLADESSQSSLSSLNLSYHIQSRKHMMNVMVLVMLAIQVFVALVSLEVLHTSMDSRCFGRAQRQRWCCFPQAQYSIHTGSSDSLLCFFPSGRNGDFSDGLFDCVIAKIGCWACEQLGFTDQKVGQKWDYKQQLMLSLFRISVKILRAMYRIDFLNNCCCQAYCF